MPVYQVRERDLRQRADVLIQNRNPQLSRGFIKKLANEGRLSFQSKPIAAGFKLKAVGRLELDYDLKLLEEQPVLKLNIVYEDDDLLVVNKPSGVLAHARSRYWQEASIASSLRHYCNWPRLRQSTAVDELRLGIVHRLDRGTSGLMVCAKNQAALSNLQSQFEARQVEKSYLGLVTAEEALPKKGLIDKPVGRDLKRPQRFQVSARGKSAQTAFEILAEGKNARLLAIKPLTGRTHQIRVHFVSLGLPLIGDALYGGPPAERLMLHAHRLAIKHPGDGRAMNFTARRPKVFAEALQG